MAQQAEAKLASIEELCELFERLGDGIFLWDEDLRLIARNDLACRLYGLDPRTVRPGIDIFALVGRLPLGTRGRNAPPVEWDDSDRQETKQRILEDFRRGASFELHFDAPKRRVLMGNRAVFRDGILATVIIDITGRVKDAEALNRQRSYLETITENMGEGVALLDEEGCCIAYNQPLLKLYDVDPSKVRTGDHIEEMIRQDGDLRRMGEAERAEAIAERSAFATTKGAGTRRAVRELADGRTLEVTRTGLAGGRAVLVARDVTNEAEVARQRSYLEAMVESVSEGVMLLDKDRNIVALNQKLLDHYQIPPGEFWPGQPARRFVEVQGDLDNLPRDEQERRRAERLDFAYDESTEVSSRRRELGNGRVLHVTRIPLADGSALGVYRDITEEEERAALLNRARREAEEASRLKSEFLARMSHELRTPMQGVLGMAALLEQTELDDRQSRFLEVIRASGNHMLRLIEDLLTLSTGDTAELQLYVEPVRICQLVGEVAGVVRPMAEKRGLGLDHSIAPDAHVMVEADATRLFQILVNLMMNAVRYTGEGGVSLEVATSAPVREGYVALRFAVADTGRGIPASELDRIFERFYQVESARGEVKEGVGLGLAVASSLAKTMGGRIDVRSAVGEGSVFTLEVELPLSEG